MKAQLPTDLSTNWAEILTGEMLFVGLLGKLWYEFPDQTWYQALLAEDVFAEAPFAGDQPEVAAGLAALRGWQVRLGAGGLAEAFEGLIADYMHLFMGPGKLLAAPWESVYRSPDGLVFQEQTLELRAWYRRFGLEASRTGQEPDDHIGLELAFLAHLASLGLAALEAGDTARLAETLEAQHAFLDTHLWPWAPAWCQQVEAGSTTVFYQSAARLTRGVLAALMALPAPSAQPAERPAA